LSLALLIDAQDTLLNMPSEDILVHIETIPCDFSVKKILKLTSLLMHKTRKIQLAKIASTDILPPLSSSASSSSATSPPSISLSEASSSKGFTSSSVPNSSSTLQSSILSTTTTLPTSPSIPSC